MSLALVASVLGLVAVVRTLRWEVQWGSVAQWVAGCGSILAAVAAVGIAVYGNRKQRKEARDRAIRRAKRIDLGNYIVNLQPGNPQAGQAYSSAVTNQGSNPIYEVMWYPPITVSRRSPDTAQVWCDTTAQLADGTNVLNAKPQVLEVGRRSSIKLDRLADRVLKVYPLVTFVDDDGYRFGWTLRPGRPNPSELREAQFEGEWSFVDDAYPYVTSGILDDLLNRAEGWAPRAGG